MATIVRRGITAIAVFVVAAGSAQVGGAAEKNAAAVPKKAIDALLTRLDIISRDRDMTTAKKAVVAAEAMEKFNQQYKGKPLAVRLKVQDVVPCPQGHYLTAARPDLDGVQFFTSKFQAKLSQAEVMSVTKESVLVVAGMVTASNQPPPRSRSDILKPGGSITFPLRANPGCRICLDNISYQLEAAPKSTPEDLTAIAAPAAVAAPTGGSAASVSPLPADAAPASDAPLLTLGKTGGANKLADKLKNEQLRGVDDIKSFFLKGIVQAQRPYAGVSTASAAKTAAGQNSGPSSRPNSAYGSRPNSAYGAASSSSYGSASNSGHGAVKVKHNRIYTAAEILQKFGSPSSRSSKTTLEDWVFKCRDGVVHVQFTEVGYAGSLSASNSDKLRLEVKAVDSSSSPSTGTRTAR